MAQKDEFVHNNKLYKTTDNWFTFGIGGAINTELKEREININAAYHFRVWKIYLQPGYHRCSDEFIYNSSMMKSRSLQKVNDFYLGVGLRSSKLYSNVAFFIGPSVSYGSKFHSYNSDNEKLYIGFTTPGIYANFDFSYKLSYDLGIGVSLYNSYSKEYHVYGFQFHLYFSGGFRKDV